MAEKDCPQESTPHSDASPERMLARLIADLSKGEMILEELERRGEDVTDLRRQYAPQRSLLALARKMQRKLAESHSRAEIAALCAELKTLVKEAGTLVQGLREVAAAPKDSTSPVVNFNGDLVAHCDRLHLPDVMKLIEANTYTDLSDISDDPKKPKN